MSKQLNVPSNADETTPDDTPAAGGIEYTARELAIAEDRDPDEVVETEEAEAVEEVEEQLADEVADDTVSDPPADDTPAGPWYSPREVQYAAERYGLSEWDLQQFDSAAEFRKAAYLLDAQAAKNGKFAKSHDEPKTPAKEPEYVDEPIVDGKLNVEWYRKNGYDDATIKALSHQQDRLSYFEQKFAEQEKLAEQQRAAAEQAEAQRIYEAFSDAASSHRPDFYGKTHDEYGNPVRLTAQQEKRRQELYEEVYWLAQRFAFEQERKGQPVAVPSFGYLIKQAEVRAPFAQELTRQDREKQLADAKAQARTIRPAAGSVGAGTAKRAPSPPSDDPKSLAQDPDVIAAWKKATGEAVAR